MLNKFLVLVLLVISFSGCSEDEQSFQPDLSVDSIVGTWKLTESYVSPGGETTWQQVEDGYKYTFGADGSFSSTNNSECEGVFERSEDTITITRLCEGSTEEETFSMIIAALENGGLEIYNPRCIEACIYRFEKQ